MDLALLRRQREMLWRIAHCVRQGKVYRPEPEDADLFEGLINMTDVLADLLEGTQDLGVLLPRICGD